MKHKNLTIPDAKHICRMCQGTGVIVVVFDDRSRGLAGVSYGLDRRRCQAAGKGLDQIIDAIGAGEIVVVPEE